jgi:hypothetical protein
VPRRAKYSADFKTLYFQAFAIIDLRRLQPVDHTSSLALHWALTVARPTILGSSLTSGTTRPQSVDSTIDDKKLQAMRPAHQEEGSRRVVIVAPVANGEGSASKFWPLPALAYTTVKKSRALVALLGAKLWTAK